MDRERLEEIANGAEYTEREAEELAMMGLTGLDVVIRNGIHNPISRGVIRRDV